MEHENKRPLAPVSYTHLYIVGHVASVLSPRLFFYYKEKGASSQPNVKKLESHSHLFDRASHKGEGHSTENQADAQKYRCLLLHQLPGDLKGRFKNRQLSTHIGLY